MHFSLATVILATLASTVSATNFPVTVGEGGLIYNPSSINAAPGDTVSFTFFPKNHTVTQSSFTAPCEPLAGGIDSNFQPVAANASNVPQFSITVNATTPLWFFCRQVNHCETGMVFAINPTANKTFAQFQATANASNSANGSPPSSSSNTTGSGSGSGSGSSSGTAAGSAASSTSTSKSNGAVAVGARAGGFLAVVGFAAGILL
jgi:plastocyanin